MNPMIYFFPIPIINLDVSDITLFKRLIITILICVFMVYISIESNKTKIRLLGLFVLLALVYLISTIED